MYELKVVQLLSKLPVFSLADLSKITKSRFYAKKLLPSLVRKGIIKKIVKDKYTLLEDSMTIAPFLHYPSYISCASALSFHGMISQIPSTVFLMTSKRSKTISFTQKIEYFHTKHFFGYKNFEHEGFSIPIAEPEKAFIDSIGIHPLHVVMEGFDELDKKNLLEYGKKTGQLKRIGYLLEKNGHKVNMAGKISFKNIFLDPLGPKKGKKDKKWKLTDNF